MCYVHCNLCQSIMCLEQSTEFQAEIKLFVKIQRGYPEVPLSRDNQDLSLG